MKLTKRFYQELDENPFKIQELEDNDFKRLFKTLNASFHEKGINLISDDAYDKIKDYIDEHKLFDTTMIGAPVKKTQAVKLPYWMGSMNKLKNDSTKQLDNWVKKYKDTTVISDKLDGVSALYVFDENKKESLYTRGDGQRGRDITHLIRKINGFFNVKPTHPIVVRGELVITRNTFDQLLHTKQLPTNSNPRNTVAGLVNSKTFKNDLLQYIDFVAYELIRPDDIIPSDQLDRLAEYNFKVVHYKYHHEINIDILTTTLNIRKQQSEYDIDGIVVTSDTVQIKNTSGNPDYAFAFKLPTNDVDVKVTDVLWEVSKDKYMKPIVVFDEVFLSGAKIKRATGFNAKFILDNMIGKHSVITITRSGEVIPYIKKIVKKSDEPLFPDCDYIWTKNKVDIIMVDNNKTSKILGLKQFQSTISSLKIDGLRDSTVEKFFNNDINSLKQLFDVHLTEVLRNLHENGKLPGLGYKQISKITKSINERKQSLTCIDLMVASNKFGRGISHKTLDLIIHTFPNMLRTKPTIQDMRALNGIGTITATQVYNLIDEFNEYLTSNNLSEYCSVTQQKNQKTITTNLLFSGKVILFSGTKDKKLIEFIAKQDGTITTTISKKVHFLIIDDPEKETEKNKKAQQCGMEIGETILTPSQFKKKFNLDF